MLRRGMLLLSFLISGGSLIFPRLPILLLMTLLALAATRIRPPSRQGLSPLFAFFASILLVSFVRPGPIHLESLAIRFANFVGALLLLNVYLRAPAGALARDLAAILHWMAIQAIATAVLALFVEFLFVTINVDDSSFQSLLLVFNYHVLIENTGSLVRPNGFFFEPGVFQFYLNLYLYLTLFVLRNRGHSLLALAAVISTQSTTGLLICTLLLVAALWQGFGSGRLRQKAAVLLVALVVAPPVAFISYANITDKLSGESQGSSWAREYDFFTGLNVISEYPLLGIGFDHARYLAVSSRLSFADSLLSQQGMEDRATSNSLIYLTYTLGIPLATVVLVGMFRQQFFRDRFLIGILLVLSLFSEAIVYTPFILMIVFSAFVVNRRGGARVPRTQPRLPA